jgi:hypothetical protein
MVILQTFLTNLVLTKSSVPKCHAVLFTALIFASFCVCYTGLIGKGGGRQTGRTYTVELSQPAFSSHLSQMWAVSPTNPAGGLAHTRDT